MSITKGGATLDEFKAWSLSQGQVGNPGSGNGSFKGQCVSEVQSYIYYVYGIEYRPRGDAKDWPTNSDVLSYFDKVTDLKEGDIITYGADYGGGYGHIGVYSGGQLLDQNGHQAFHVAVGSVFPGRSAILRRKGGSEVTDINTCRRIAYSVWGINGIYDKKNALNGDVDAMFKSDPAWLGADTNVCLQTRFDAPEAHAYQAWVAKQASGGGKYTPVSEPLYRKVA